MSSTCAIGVAIDLGRGKHNGDNVGRVMPAASGDASPLLLVRGSEGIAAALSGGVVHID